MSDLVGTQLYVISPPSFDLAGFSHEVEQEIETGAIACFQLWMPDQPKGEVEKAVKVLCPILQQKEIAFLVNDHVDLAKAYGCDGVHLDEADKKAITSARKTLGPDAIIGVSCKASRHDAMVAAEAGADYVSFGPVFASKTKGLDANPAALECLSWWAEMMEVPCVAIGGITPQNTAHILVTGCEFIAAIGSVWDYTDGVKRAVDDFSKVLTVKG